MAVGQTARDGDAAEQWDQPKFGIAVAADAEGGDMADFVDHDGCDEGQPILPAEKPDRGDDGHGGEACGVDVKADAVPARPRETATQGKACDCDQAEGEG